MIMKQSMNSGTLDNISCIFISFNNFKKIMNPKFNNVLSTDMDIQTNMNKSQAFNVRNEYNEYKFGNDLNNNISDLNFDDIRKKLSYLKENSIKLKTNEYIHFSHYNNHNREFEKKPKTSSEVVKKERLEFNNDNSEIEYKPVNTNIDNSPSNMEDNQLYKIVSKKLKSPLIDNYETNLPSFKLSKRITNNKNHRDLNLNMGKIATLDKNKNGNILNGYITNTENSDSNMNLNSTLKNNNRFLPNITKNIGTTTLYNDRKNHNTGNFRLKQLNFNYNK